MIRQTDTRTSHYYDKALRVKTVTVKDLQSLIQNIFCILNVVQFSVQKYVVELGQKQLHR